MTKEEQYPQHEKHFSHKHNGKIFLVGLNGRCVANVKLAKSFSITDSHSSLYLRKRLRELLRFGLQQNPGPARSAYYNVFVEKIRAGVGIA